ncbi:hypothetical protein [Stenotrophomonas mori]|uniref:Kazal-like domain-containing protein n=1 Tax=Stenotrophomonas mori TaxID=2871096 RepID=A0ABT0SH59_9GAMM|nr:hypothetical protein [Stenotrophomonas mori]MCL7714641.1 hypothetical protein [Stenotrophomonas mori]
MKKVSKFFVISVLALSVLGSAAYAAETFCTRSCRLAYEQCKSMGGNVDDCGDAYIDCLYKCQVP